MNQIEQICQEAEQIFKSEPGKLQKEANSWLKGLRIVKHTIYPWDKIVVIAEDMDAKTQNKFFIFRFFQIGENWNVSADLNGVNFETLIGHLLKEKESRNR